MYEVLNSLKWQHKNVRRCCFIERYLRARPSISGLASKLHLLARMLDLLRIYFTLAVFQRQQQVKHRHLINSTPHTHTLFQTCLSEK